jgi:hypothetical protein
MTQPAQRFCATLSSVLLVLSFWLPTVTVPLARQATIQPTAAGHLVFASASPIVLM